MLPDQYLYWITCIIKKTNIAFDCLSALCRLKGCTHCSSSRAFDDSSHEKAQGGVLCLEKGTICGPTDAERWLSQREMAKKGGCPLIILYDKGVVRFFASNILYHITSVYIQICS